ncbi:MAG: hypothetical protein D6819_08900 [Gammaproteobacteria bacterium]|nr:MAG: hypothetical protein D6819_08900 [Gammaproteobacteria bacterium]
MPDSYAVPVTLCPPVRTKHLHSHKKAKLILPLPSQPILGVHRPGEPIPEGPWGEMLAKLGWKWAITAEQCHPPLYPLFKVWLSDGHTILWREHALAALLGLGKTTPTLEQLREALGVALVQKDTLRIFDLDPIAPDWRSEILSARFERQPTRRLRRPGHPWLDGGYALIHESFWEGAMGRCRDLNDFVSLWQAHFGNADLPLAFELVYWWEVHYRLSEHQREADAAQALAKVDELAGKLASITRLVDPWWSLQQARELYYQGDLPRALAAFHEARTLLQHDPRPQSNLLRHLAGVLSDMGCLEQAYPLARQALEWAERLGLEDERFKALGRLGELDLKRGYPDQARAWFQKSLAIQERIGESTSRTHIYLGHAALLQDQLDDAEAAYRTAEQYAREGDYPYLLMGQAALAQRREDCEALVALWRKHDQDWRAWLGHPTRALPAATALLATYPVYCDKALIVQAVEALIQQHYLLEAIALWGYTGFDPEKRLRHLLKDELTSWQAAVRSIYGSEGSEASQAYDQLLRHAPQEMPAWAYPLTLPVRKKLFKNLACFGC